MDNFSNSMENATEEQTADAKNVGDIQFEDIMDIDKLQARLNQELENEKLGIKSDEPDEKETNNDEPKVIKPIVHIKADPNSKKYVIYIDEDNVDYIENLSLDERKSIINKIIKEQKNITAEQKKFRERKKYVINVLIAVITFILGFPIVFFCVNTAMQASMLNYQQAKQNFSKLYKEHGKIKPANLNSNKN